VTVTTKGDPVVGVTVMTVVATPPPGPYSRPASVGCGAGEMLALGPIVWVTTMVGLPGAVGSMVMVTAVTPPGCVTADAVTV
jgi:hypothetical protein